MIREKRERLKIIFWNTAGIGNKDEEFWKYLREFDIINLTETWIELKKLEEGRKMATERIHMGNTRCIQRQKKGRSAGGMITGIRKTLKVKNVGKEKKRYFMHSFRIKRGEMENNISIQQDGKKRIFEEP